MRVSAWALLWSVPRKSKAVSLSYRYYGPRDTVQPTSRTFHISLSRHLPDDGTSVKSDPQDVTSLSNSVIISEEPDNTSQLSRDGSDNGSDPASEPSRAKDPNNYGSATRRARRNRPKELPTAPIPPWFVERNIRWGKDISVDVGKRTENEEEKPLQSSSEGDSSPSTGQEVGGYELGHMTRSEKARPQPSPNADSTEKEVNTYDGVFLEVSTLVRAGLRVPSIPDVEAATVKSHLVLCCPRPGAIRYLRNLVARCTDLLDGVADIVRLDAHDIAEIGGQYIDESDKLKPNTLSSLSYDVSAMLESQTPAAVEEQSDEEDPDEDGDDDAIPLPTESSFPKRMSNMASQRGPIDVGVGIMPIGTVFGSVQEALKTLGGSTRPSGPSGFSLKGAREGADNTYDLKMGCLIETLIACRGLQKHARPSSDTSKAQVQSRQTDDRGGKQVVLSDLRAAFDMRNLVVLIEDYSSINMTLHGNKFLRKLHDVVDAKRQDGQPILIIGTASTRDVLANDSTGGLKQAQGQPSAGPTRTVIVPVEERVSEEDLVQENAQRTRATNIRHIRNMIWRLSPSPKYAKAVSEDWDMDIDRKASFLVDMDDNLLPMDSVDRISTLALGLKAENEEVTTSHIESAMHMMCESDDQKSAWLKGQRALDKTKKPGKASQVDSEENLQRLRQKCNRHEKKLLSGVVDPANIKTTFADVRAQPETIEALKNLTSLSLIRPEAFTYGVLANNRIQGLLLYGPPGTGKTLLAKAVAKESGATVLEVSGSDVYDMYVGEGEKNVRAIFSLAKKLAPCVVFIDEGDAILGSRGGTNNRNSHRELINQFLREWDGMTDSNAFIMVATNRPFDLDEASLRRLPRRLLIDLPTEKDREAILKIHLKDEQLNPEISLESLASETPYYSGSDLKNLSVAAALACVREEVDKDVANASSTTEKAARSVDHRLVEKRTLFPRHFKKAMEEISASINEDMRSLSAIRKFDEKYGDRRGRRKKLGSYGFKTASDGEKKGSDAARVRNQ